MCAIAVVANEGEQGDDWAIRRDSNVGEPFFGERQVPCEEVHVDRAVFVVHSEGEQP